MTIHTNKDITLMKPERASVPGMRNEKKKLFRQSGSVTIEASFGIPLFLFAALCLIWLIEIQSIRISITNAVHI